jgi:hypothetical protein
MAETKTMTKTEYALFLLTDALGPLENMLEVQRHTGYTTDQHENHLIVDEVRRVQGLYLATAPCMDSVEAAELQRQQDKDLVLAWLESPGPATFKLAVAIRRLLK